MDADLARIAFVTRRYADLHGLRAVAYGASLLGAILVFDLLPKPIGGGLYLQIVLGAQLLAEAARQTLTTFYRERFGCAPRPSPSVPADHAAALFPEAVFTGLMVDALLMAVLPVLPWIGPAIMVGYSLWVLVRDWPHRSYYLVPLASGVSAVVIAVTAPRGAHRLLDDPVFGGHFVAVCGLTALGILVAGIFDHGFLTSATRRFNSDGVAATDAGGREFARLRMVVAAGTLLAVAAHLVFAVSSLAAELQYLGYSIWVSLVSIAVVSRMIEWSRDQRARDRALGRERDARLLRGFGVTDGGEAASDTTPLQAPMLDFWGHIVLPLAMACGLLLDIWLRRRGFPSFLALALAASHARIAWREWPLRRHYVAGVISASFLALQYMRVGHGLQPIQWAFWFAVLVGASTLIEGTLDHLSRKKERYAHTV